MVADAVVIPTFLPAVTASLLLLPLALVAAVGAVAVLAVVAHATRAERRVSPAVEPFESPAPVPLAACER